MVRLGDAILPSGTPPEMIETLEGILAIINNGRYQFRVSDEAPTEDTDHAESVFVPTGNDAGLYVYDKVNEVWSRFVPRGAEDTPLPVGHLYGGIISNNSSDATNDLDISEVWCKDDTNEYDIHVSALTKQVDAAWAAGTNAGGFDTGTVGAVADLIYIFAIGKSDDDDAGDIIFSKSRTDITYPVGGEWDIKRLLGHRYWTGSAWASFYTYGRGTMKWVYLYTTLQLLSNGSDTSFADIDCSGVVDGNIAGIIDVNGSVIQSTVSSVVLYARPNGSSQAAGEATYFHWAQDDQSGPGNPRGASLGHIPIDASSIFEYAVSGGTADFYLRGYCEDAL